MIQLAILYNVKRKVRSIHSRVSDIFTPHLYSVFHYKELEDGPRIVNYRNKERKLSRRNRTFYSEEVYSLCLLYLIITNNCAIVKVLLVIRSCMETRETNVGLFDYA